jgi:exosortase
MKNTDEINDALAQDGGCRKTQRISLIFFIYVGLCAAVFSQTLRDLIRLSLSSNAFSYLLIVPFITLALVALRRKEIFQQTPVITIENSIILILAAVGGSLAVYFRSFLDVDYRLIFSAAALASLVLVGFVILYGRSAARVARFPLLFLFLIVPPPQLLMDKVIRVLQVASANLTYWIFIVTGTPVLRQGMTLALPGVTIEVAPECSGIRSTIAVLITCLLAGYLLLRSPLSRMILIVAALPVVVLKNAIRIVTLTLLSIHVDPSFLTGRLHRQGGFVFFGIGLLILLPILRWREKVDAANLAHGALGPT